MKQTPNPSPRRSDATAARQREALSIMRRNRRGLRARGLGRGTLSVVEVHIRLTLDDPRHSVAGTARVEGITRQTAQGHLEKAREAGLLVRVGRLWFLNAAGLLAQAAQFVRERLAAALARRKAKAAKTLAFLESVRQGRTHTTSVSLEPSKTPQTVAQARAELAEIAASRSAALSAAYSERRRAEK